MNDFSLLIGRGVFGPFRWFSQKNKFYLSISAICAPLTKTSLSYRGPVTFQRALKWSTKATLYKYYSCPVFWLCFEHSFFCYCSQQQYVYYDMWWACQHTLFVWLSSLLMLMMFMLPLNYCDALHKCALHLGGWERYPCGHRDTPHV